MSKTPKNEALISAKDKNKEVILHCFAIVIKVLTAKTKPNFKENFEATMAKLNFDNIVSIFNVLEAQRKKAKGDELTKIINTIYSLLCSEFSKLVAMKKHMTNPSVFKNLSVVNHQWRYPSIESMEMALSQDKFSEDIDSLNEVIAKILDKVPVEKQEETQKRFANAIKMLPNNFGTNESLVEALEAIEASKE